MGSNYLVLFIVANYLMIKITVITILMICFIIVIDISLCLQCERYQKDNCFRFDYSNSSFPISSSFSGARQNSLTLRGIEMKLL